MWFSGQSKPDYNTINDFRNNTWLTSRSHKSVILKLKAHVNNHIENYTDLEDKEITAFVKYSYFNKEQQDKEKGKINSFHSDQLYYNIETDAYYCPMEQAATNIGNYNRKTITGFEKTITRYQAQNCNGCSLKSLCYKSKYNCIIERNYNRIRLKAKTLLTSERDIAKRKKRCWDVEAIFKNIKHNMNFKRFMLRGIDKVTTEIGLIAIAHNLKKHSSAI